MRLVNTFIFATYGAMNNLLLMPNLVAFYAKQIKYKKNEFHFALEVSFSILFRFPRHKMVEGHIEFTLSVCVFQNRVRAIT